MKDLFGVEVIEIDPKPSNSLYIAFKKRNNYRNALYSDKSCKYCNYRKIINHHGKRYNKCVLIGESKSTATDIKTSSVCELFEKARGL